MIRKYYFPSISGEFLRDSTVICCSVNYFLFTARSDCDLAVQSPISAMGNEKTSKTGDSRQPLNPLIVHAIIGRFIILLSSHNY